MKQNKSFTDLKCLLWKDQMDGIVNKQLLSPIMVNIDPTNRCNMHCLWCNGKHINPNIEIKKSKMLVLLNELCNFGVKSICFAGGGEPSLHKDLDTFIMQAYIYKMQIAILTNGYNWNKQLINCMGNFAKRVGISIDVSSEETLYKAKKVSGLNKILNNIKSLNKIKNNGMDVTYKFLIHPLNQHEIYEAAKIAKDVGCNLFHLRPVDFLAYQDKIDPLDINLIKNQIELGKKLDDDNFKFVAYFDSFNDDITPIRYDKCALSPLLGICAPDGWWLCIDRKGQEGLRLCDIDKIREFWGSEEHFEIINRINPKTDCGKCTLSKYYENFYSFKNDEFYWRFV